MGERRIALKIGSADKLLESLEVGRRMNGNGGVMLARRRHLWRFFCLLLSVLASATMSHAQALAMTNISDVVYRADGTPASGVLLISWPAFSTSDGKPVASGTKNVTLGAQGALSVSLAPNAGATPAATYYTVVYQLSDTVKTEFWTVGTTSPIASRDIADEEKFKEGLAKVIDGTVECLNASIWAKANQP